MLTVLIFSIPFLLGWVCGLRAMTGPAIVCWAAHLHWIEVDGTKLAFLHHSASLVIFTALALGELVADKLPFIPRRTMIGPLVVRIFSGALCALALGFSMIGASAVGMLTAFAGGAGAIAGAFAGYHFRRWLTVGRGLPDLPIALLEDAVAIGLGLLAASGGLVSFLGFR